MKKVIGLKYQDINHMGNAVAVYGGEYLDRRFMSNELDQFQNNYHVLAVVEPDSQFATDYPVIMTQEDLLVTLQQTLNRWESMDDPAKEIIDEDKSLTDLKKYLTAKNILKETRSL